MPRLAPERLADGLHAFVSSGPPMINELYRWRLVGGTGTWQRWHLGAPWQSLP